MTSVFIIIINLFLDLEDEEFHKKFVESLRNKKVEYKLPDFLNPDLPPPEEKKEAILYEEDVNEYLEDELAVLPEEDLLMKAKKIGERKELKLVNHSEITYEKFVKNLYIETKEISNIPDNIIALYRKKNGDIKVRGKNIPKPFFNWYQIGLPDKVLEILEKKKFKAPFPIQEQTIPCIMSGRDVIGIAETGSGKTLAYLLPMIRHISHQRPVKDGEGPIALIMAPTRELAFQISLEVKVNIFWLKLI